MKVYERKDFVTVVDEQGNELPSVPKAWVGTDLLLPGVKKASKSTAASASAPATPAPREPGAEPAGNASRGDWEAFAKEKGAKDEDLVDEQGKPLGRDELRAKYGTPAP